ncbi:hypothetical protein APR11_001041 [Nocardia amikacinitolerans]|uniref:hypothetical protein n=1 Tax=Nocardia amikacinitolerans TaxID=756689 RepID=UPI0020A2ECCD|nr:hypothetical protein [Nocardia amikacinitolerans]MCP2294634.1 hypothetical protein [Nocardia amikacinitolerans]
MKIVGSVSSEKTRVRLLFAAAILMVVVAVVHEAVGYFWYVDPLVEEASGISNSVESGSEGQPVMMAVAMYHFVGWVFLVMGLAPAWAARLMRGGEYRTARALLVVTLALLWAMVATFVVVNAAFRGFDDILILAQWTFFVPSLLLVHLALRGMPTSQAEQVSR